MEWVHSILLTGAGRGDSETDRVAPAYAMQLPGHIKARDTDLDTARGAIGRIGWHLNAPGPCAGLPIPAAQSPAMHRDAHPAL